MPWESTRYRTFHENKWASDPPRRTAHRWPLVLSIDSGGSVRDRRQVDELEEASFSSHNLEEELQLSPKRPLIGLAGRVSPPTETALG